AFACLCVQFRGSVYVRMCEFLDLCLQCVCVCVCVCALAVSDFSLSLSSLPLSLPPSMSWSLYLSTNPSPTSSLSPFYHKHTQEPPLGFSTLTANTLSHTHTSFSRSVKHLEQSVLLMLT